MFLLSHSPSCVLPATDTVMRRPLASKARLVRRLPSGTPLLVYPERALELNTSALQIVELCDGEHSLDQIVDRLSAAYPDEPRERLRASVQTVIETLEARALIEGAP